MCGICGIAGHADGELLTGMNASLHHRGPDDGGIYLSPDGRIGLGNRRLAIIDLSAAGHMPMSTPAGDIWITYNGEVYNFPELRRELEQKGVRFVSATDSEVVLHLYAEYGMEAFERLNGMFALAIWDARREQLILARDRLGIKPLYYTSVNGDLLFASEIKAFLRHPQFQTRIDPESLHYYLTHLWVPGPGTMLEGVRKLAPGHTLCWRDGATEIKPFWQIAWSESARGTPAELADELRSILARAVKRHMIADVPIGLFLSGGLDSTTLLALMSQASPQPVAAYTIAFREEDARLEQSAGEDVKFAELAARKYGANFHRIEVDPQVADLLPRVVWHLDEPVADPAAINSLLISEAAQGQATVLLSGQGADEVLAGYRVHQADRYSRLLSIFPKGFRNGMMSRGLHALPRLAEKIPGLHPGVMLAVNRYFGKILENLPLAPEERYIANRSYYSQSDLLRLYRAELRADFARFDAGARHRAYFAETADQDFTNQMLHVDLKTFLPELNLTYSDKLSMAASIETRVPFLDNEVVDFLSGIPADLKLRGFTGKYLLRKAAASLAPTPIIRRRKAGFGAPIRKWLSADLQPLMADVLSPASIKQRGYFEPDAIHKLQARHQAGLQDNTYQLWALLVLEIWCETFLDRSGDISTTVGAKHGPAKPDLTSPLGEGLSS